MYGILAFNLFSFRPLIRFTLLPSRSSLHGIRSRNQFATAISATDTVMSL